MKKFVNVIFVFILALFFYGCGDELSIQGSSHIYINESQPYKVVALSDEIEGADSYKWKVKSKNKDFTLTNDDTQTVIFNAQSVGKYTLEVKVKKGHKPLKAEIHIEVTEPEVINGHMLPSEPDKTINDSTLLGVDVNNNGVRDDVERWIYTYYEKPIEHAVFMQSARAYQIVIQEPEKALETMKYLDDVSDCESYWKLRAKRKNESFWLERYKDYDKEINPVQFNTADRFLAYKKYNQTLSGGVYSSSPIGEWKNRCDFNTTTLIKNP